MRFLRPDLLQWSLVIPVLVASCALHWRFRRAFRRRAAIDARFADLSHRTTGWRDAAACAAGVVAASAVVFALMRPQLLPAHRVPDYERQDLIVILDRSVSMHARDIRPSRFSRATLELRNLLRQKPEGIDRVGLVGFADSSLVLSYLTSDVESLLFYLDWLDSESPALFGTNIGAALKSAMDVAKKDDRPTRKRYLLVSDGEDYGAELRTALDALRAAGSRVDCIGVGTDEPVPIPLTASDDEESYLRDDAGRRVTTTFEEATLTRIAAATGGRYVRSTTGTELARAIADVVKGERRLLGWRSATEYRDLYPAALAVAGVAAAALCFLV
jgi:Ca-activated chloride channel family protein